MVDSVHRLPFYCFIILDFARSRTTILTTSNSTYAIRRTGWT